MEMEISQKFSIEPHVEHNNLLIDTSSTWNRLIFAMFSSTHGHEREKS
jgi:hypothetical protein